jgi:hypothetical protein
VTFEPERNHSTWLVSVIFVLTIAIAATWLYRGPTPTAEFTGGLPGQVARSSDRLPIAASPDTEHDRPVFPSGITSTDSIRR